MKMHLYAQPQFSCIQTLFQSTLAHQAYTTYALYRLLVTYIYAVSRYNMKDYAFIA